MRQKLTSHYKDFLGYDKARAKQLADQVISYRVDSLAKEAEKDEVSARAFYKAVVAMYKALGLKPPQLLDFHYYTEPDVMDTKL